MVKLDWVSLGTFYQWGHVLNLDRDGGDQKYASEAHVGRQDH